MLKKMMLQGLLAALAIGAAAAGYAQVRDNGYLNGPATAPQDSARPAKPAKADRKSRDHDREHHEDDRRGADRADAGKERS